MRREIEESPGVLNAHHTHVWRLGERDIAMECHVEVEDMSVSESGRIISEIEERMRKFGITHVNVQVESGRCRSKGDYSHIP